MNLRKSHLAAAVGAALLVGGTAAQAQVTNAQQGIQVQLYGQVSRALMFVDDGHQSKWFHVDGQPSSTRIGINASAPVGSGLRVGGRIETEIKSNPSDTVNFGTPSIGSGPSGVATFVERWLDAFVEGSWGRVNMGQGSGAADDASTLDLSGTNMPNGTCPTDWGGGISFRTSAGGTATGPMAGVGAAGALGNCNDFESRSDRIMYTTPTFGGFRAQVGQGQRTGVGESTEASVWYSGKLAGDLQAAIGWSNVNLNTITVPDRETIGGSIAWLHTSGFNLAAAYTSTEGISGSVADGRKGKMTWLKAGYKFGQHAIAVDYGIYDDQAAASDEGTSIGIGYVWTPQRWAELYAGYHLFTLDRPGVSLEDIMVFALGTRIRF
jgi:predicted porin